MKKQGRYRKAAFGNRGRTLVVESLESRQMLAANPGWDGTGLGSADLTYHIENTPSNLSIDQVRSAIETALKAWSDVVNVNFTEVSQAGLANSIDFDFAQIDGMNGTLAEAYFPDTSAWAGSQPGDVTFDSSETWEIGNALGSQAVDLVAVAVHEIGHALGLDHSSDQNSIMYPSISAAASFTGLSPIDIAAIRSIYQAKETPTATSPEDDSTTTGGSTTGENADEEQGTDSDSNFGTNTGTQPTGGNTPAIDPRAMPGILVTINDSIIDKFFARYDTNGDQDLTSDELPYRTMKLLQQLNIDTNQDDAISLDELKTGVSDLQRKFFDRIDSDASGTIGESEVASSVWQLLSRADQDADGVISLDEFVAFQQKTMFERIDTNQDSQLTEDEVPTRLWQQLTRFDQDDNASISTDEYSSFANRFNQQQYRHGRYFAGHGRFGVSQEMTISVANHRVTIRISPPNRHWR